METWYHQGREIPGLFYLIHAVEHKIPKSIFTRFEDAVNGKPITIIGYHITDHPKRLKEIHNKKTFYFSDQKNWISPHIKQYEYKVKVTLLNPRVFLFTYKEYEIQIARK